MILKRNRAVLLKLYKVCKLSCTYKTANKVITNSNNANPYRSKHGVIG